MSLWWVVCLDVMMPVAVGAACGRGVGRKLGAWSNAAVLAALGVGLWGANLGLELLAIWDALSLLLLAAAGWMLGRAPVRTALARLLAVVLFVGVATLAAQDLLDPVPALAGDRDHQGVGLLAPGGPGAAACAMAYDVEAAGLPSEQWRSRAMLNVHGDRPVVGHLGDSMLTFAPTPSANHGVDEARRFPDLLDAGDPVYDHVNLGRPGISYDIQLMVARHLMREVTVRRFFVHAFLENDLGELDRPLPCCPGGGVLLWDEPGLPPRCDEPVSPFPTWPHFGALMSRSPAPRWIRQLTPHLQVVATLRYQLARVAWLSGGGRGWQDVNDLVTPDEHPRIAQAWARTRLVLTTLRDEAEQEGADVIVVTLPVGPEVGVPGSVARRRVEQMGALATELGLPWWDAWDVFGPTPDPQWFMADGYHLSYEGHARLAAWIRDR